MWSWIIVGVLYVFGMGLFCLLGGLGAAADALQRWGRSRASTRADAASPSR
jgi:hypothetical protein